MPRSAPSPSLPPGGSGLRLGQILIAHVEVRIDVLHVVVLFEDADELEQRRPLLDIDWNVVLRTEHELRRFRFAESFFEYAGDFGHRFEARIDRVALFV